MHKGWVAVLMAGLLSGCGALPSLEGRSSSQAMLAHDGRDTRLAQALAPALAQHPGLSGVQPLGDPLDAFAARMVLLAAAQRTIDVQYYIWRNDITGNLMLQALEAAARRNVRVRLLVDDNGTSGMDEKLAALDAVPNVEVRLFNPFVHRRFKFLGFLADFNRLNRRMHNKSLTVDGQVTVVGGRNIGDQYFGATADIAFADLDVFVAGAVVDEVSRDFDRYWNSASAYPLRSLVAAAPSQGASNPAPDPAGGGIDGPARAYVQAVTQSRFVEDLIAGRLELQWVPVRMVSDDPAKVLDRAPPEALLLPRLTRLLGRATTSVDLISPYFIPTEQGVQAFAALAAQGIRVRVLTNAMEATDVIAVHAGYAKYRVPLLEQGVLLYELRRQAGRTTSREKAGPFGSSGSSLHAKTFAVDGHRVFVGSFNFDPRSARLNTELGFVIESAPMAQQMARAFDTEVPQRAYQVALGADRKLVWLQRDGDQVQRLTSEPSTSLWQRLSVRLLALLPIEPLL